MEAIANPGYLDRLFSERHVLNEGGEPRFLVSKIGFTHSIDKV